MNDEERLANLSARLERVNPRSHARRTDPATSKEAGYSLDPTKLEQKVLRIITNFGSHGCISDQVEHEMMKVFDVKGSSVTPRYTKLIAKGHVVDTGVKRKAISGKHQRVLMCSTSWNDMSKEEQDEMS
tara:strand:+ start:296 stop:682 length:387 start_codon:yes stop_codon:yes gene_type:complete